MSVYVTNNDHAVYEQDEDEQQQGNCENKTGIFLGSATSHESKDGEAPTITMEQEKRIRREIANSNERRRMQSINNGFQSLRLLLPHHEGEKLSKAAILQQTAEYIYNLEQEKTSLLSQNCQLKRLVNQQHDGGDLPPKKRKTEVIISTESSDEGLGSMSPEPVNVLQVVGGGETAAELKRQLERERNLRMMLEEQVRGLENQLFQQQSQQVYQVDEAELNLQLVAADSVPPVGHTQTVVCSPPTSRSPSPQPILQQQPQQQQQQQQQLQQQEQQQQQQQQQQRLPSVLEAAIKAEPKVEVERLPSPNASHEDTTPVRLYVSNRSRQNLETIVEAIRHLEGDHMFGEESQTQEAPLALTTKTTNENTNSSNSGTNSSSNVIKLEMSSHYFHPVQQQQQSRPGVIVVKQAS